jgi:ComF family protein
LKQSVVLLRKWKTCWIVNTAKNNIIKVILRSVATRKFERFMPLTLQHPWITTLLQGMGDLVYPLRCHLCDKNQPAEDREPFCLSCRTQCQNLLGLQCPRCAAPFPTMPANASNCPHCQNEEFAFTSVIAWGLYQPPLRSLILQLKHQAHEALAYHSGMMLARQFQTQLNHWPIEAVVPVPLHWSRRFWRGYNQAEVMASAVAKVLRKPLRTWWLWRTRKTPLQASVTPLQRHKNLIRSMKAYLPVTSKGQHILLIDDVLTTGSTADACARALLQAGAGSVRVLVLARALGETANSQKDGRV